MTQEYNPAAKASFSQTMTGNCSASARGQSAKAKPRKTVLTKATGSKAAFPLFERDKKEKIDVSKIQKVANGKKSSAGSSVKTKKAKEKPT